MLSQEKKNLNDHQNKFGIDWFCLHIMYVFIDYLLFVHNVTKASLHKKYWKESLNVATWKIMIPLSHFTKKKKKKSKKILQYHYFVESVGYDLNSALK